MPAGDQPLVEPDVDLAPLGMLVFLDALDDVGQIDATNTPGRLGPFAQLQHQLAHAFDGMVDRHQHVLLEFRVVAVLFGILQHQRQLGDDVLQVVHHESRHLVEGVELAYFEQRLGRLHLGQEARRLATGSAQQVIDFPIHVDRGARTGQDDETLHVMPHHQRDDQPGIGQGGNPGWNFEATVTAREAAIFLQIDDPATVEQELAKR